MFLLDCDLNHQSGPSVYYCDEDYLSVVNVS